MLRLPPSKLLRESINGQLICELSTFDHYCDAAFGDEAKCQEQFVDYMEQIMESAERLYRIERGWRKSLGAASLVERYAELDPNIQIVRIPALDFAKQVEMFGHADPTKLIVAAKEYVDACRPWRNEHGAIAQARSRKGKPLPITVASS